ncbi:LysM repeat protein, partial [Staphylococcus hominis]
MAFMSYTVQSGDNLTNIANEFGISIQSIQNYNSISNPDNIRVGDILKIPSESTHTTNYVIQYGDNLNSIANKFGTTADRLQSLNNIANPDYIQVGQTIRVSGSQGDSNQSTYTVQYGDSLEIIANKFGTTV